MDANQFDAVLKYSQDLVRQARKEANLAEFFKEVRQVLNVFDQQNLEKFFANQTIGKQDKMSILHLFQEELSPILAAFFDQIILKQEYELLYPSLAEVIQHSQTAMGQYDMKLSTVVPFTASQKLKLIEKTEKLLGLKVRQVYEEIRPELMGGFVVEVNHKVIDASVRHQLQTIEHEMK
ncbi:F0F1 ATP synthase subunit delta [Streptococcus ovuberis]|uniref:F0F1 ATP synthase subunit delta n=1 Tax=Streptococcus ovuberis TaxID=1936207 RepID=A0A7X6S1M0_9STRE|nr:F0F1 ATP synthase subunit delta [Streptococcus ovuberis]NKZ20311.1 F0F1 ATP synthase subunit delta [Streptococcus ovuberis]